MEATGTPGIDLGVSGVATSRIPSNGLADKAMSGLKTRNVMSDRDFG